MSSNYNVISIVVRSTMSLQEENINHLNKSSNEEEEYEPLPDMTAEEIMTDISDIDATIIAVRFDPQIEPDQIIDQLSKLMERRNRLQEHLQNVKATELKKFIESLQLNELQLKPFYPSQNRCKLQVNDKKVKKLMQMPPIQNNTFDKVFRTFFGKKQEERPYTEVEQLSDQYQYHIHNLRQSLYEESEHYKRKKYLSPEDTALKLRIESELVEIDKFDRTKRK